MRIERGSTAQRPFKAVQLAVVGMAEGDSHCAHRRYHRLGHSRQTAGCNTHLLFHGPAAAGNGLVSIPHGGTVMGCSPVPLPAGATCGLTRFHHCGLVVLVEQLMARRGLSGCVRSMTSPMPV